MFCAAQGGRTETEWKLQKARFRGSVCVSSSDTARVEYYGKQSFGSVVRVSHGNDAVITFGKPSAVKY